MENNQTDNITPLVNIQTKNKGNGIISTIIFVLVTIGIMVFLKNILNY